MTSMTLEEMSYVELLVTDMQRKGGPDPPSPPQVVPAPPHCCLIDD